MDEFYERRSMIEAEDRYSFTQDTEISTKAGLIGHLRADMGTGGNGFFSSWFDFREELKTDEFKAEFDEVINSLRKEGDILHNRKALASYGVRKEKSMSFPNRTVVETVRRNFPAGSRVELVRMDDPYSRLKPGSKGTVQSVDDTGTIHVRWDCGSSLGVVYGEDSCRRIGGEI